MVFSPSPYISLRALRVPGLDLGEGGKSGFWSWWQNIARLFQTSNTDRSTSDILPATLKWEEGKKRTCLETQPCLGTKVGRKESCKKSKDISSLSYFQKDPSLMKWSHSLPLALVLSFLPTSLPFMPLFPLFLFLSCYCSCSFNLFLKVQIEIPALIPEKQLCFPCPCLAQLVVWLCATISYAARSDVAKEHLVQCHFLSKPNSITMSTGPRSHQLHKISLR